PPRPACRRPARRPRSARSRSPGLPRQCEPERGPRRSVLVHEVAAARAGDPARKGEADPHPVGLTGHERLEQPRLHRGGHPPPAVAHHHSPHGAAGATPHTTTPRAPPAMASAAMTLPSTHGSAASPTAAKFTALPTRLAMMTWTRAGSARTGT